MSGVMLSFEVVLKREARQRQVMALKTVPITARRFTADGSAD
jgi:hypothetical protein